MKEEKKSWSQFEGRVNTDEVLVEKAKALALFLLSFGAKCTKNLFEILKKDKERPKVDDEKIGVVFGEIVIGYLCVVDRLAFQYLGAEKRNIFQDALLIKASEELSKSFGGKKDFLIDAYNERQIEYAGYKKFFPEKNEGAKNTLFWEIGKKIGKILESEDIVIIMSAGSCITGFTVSANLKVLFHENKFINNDHEKKLTSEEQEFLRKFLKQTVEKELDQVRELINFCDISYQFAKTHSAYLEDWERIRREMEGRLRENRLPSGVSPVLMRAMIDGYEKIIQGKLKRVRDAFQEKFGESIYNYLKTDGKTKCFIATAAYGTATHKDLDILRLFRDRILLSSRMGSIVVEHYYRYGPLVADQIKERAWLKTLVRKALIKPLTKLIKITFLKK